VTRIHTAVTLHEEAVVIRVLVADGRNNGGSQSFCFKRPPCGGAPDAAASACSRVGRGSGFLQDVVRQAASGLNPPLSRRTVLSALRQLDFRWHRRV